MEFRQASCVRQAADGRFIVAGRAVSGLDGDAGIAAFDASGEVAWLRAYGGPATDMAWAIEPLPGGDLALLGATESFAAGRDDLWLLRLDGHGNIQWERVLGGSGWEWAAALVAGSDGSVVAAGTTESFGAGASDVWLMKVDAAGSLVWQRTFGGPDSDVAGGVERTPDGGLVVVGFTRPSNLPSRGLLFKLDGAGNVLWHKVLGCHGDSGLNSVLPMPDGGFAAVGWTAGPFGGTAGWFVRLDASGNLRAERTFTSYDGASLSDLVPGVDGGFVSVGIIGSGGGRNSDMWVCKLDENGSLVLQRAYGSGNYQGARSIRSTPDGGYVVVGRGEVPTAGCVVKLNANLDIPNCSDGFEPFVLEWSQEVVVATGSLSVASQSAMGVSSASVYSPSNVSWWGCFQPQLAIATLMHGAGPGSLMCQPNPVDYGFSSTCTATPGVGSHFVGATTTCAGALQGTNPFTVGPVTADCAVAAEFALNSYRIGVVVNNPEWGTVSCAPSPATHGATVECHAVPSNGYRLRSISGCDGATVSETYRFIATGECTVSVTFEPIPDPIPALSWHGLGLAAGLLASVGALILRRTTSIP